MRTTTAAHGGRPTAAASPSTRTESGRYEIWSIDRDGGDLRPLTQAATNQPVRPLWSPDNSRLLFTDFTQRTVTIFDPRQPWTRQNPEVLPASRAQPTALFVPTAWSADGHRVAGPLGPTGIAVYDLSNHASGNVSESGTYAAFLKDGRILVNAAEKLLLVDPATRRSSELLVVIVSGYALGCQHQC